jgi:hypothetical protein
MNCFGGSEMKDYTVPIDIQSALGDRATNFCKNELARARYRFFTDARGKFIYLIRVSSDGSLQRLGRLTYEGDTENMEFAIFKSRTGKYDSKERSFPGSQHLNGKIEGALKALVEAYP